MTDQNKATDEHCAHGFYFPGGCLYCANREIERLRAALMTANANHEHFEREWYLRGDEIGRLVSDSHELMQERDGLTTKVCELLLSVQQAQQELACAVEKLAACERLLRKYLDREFNPFEPNNQSATYKELSSFLYPTSPADVGAHCAHGIPINSPSACPSCHSEQPTRS